MDDLIQARPRLRPGVILRREDAAHGIGRRIIHAPGGRCFLIGEPEAAVLVLMDGTRTVEELSRAAAPDVPGLNAAVAALFVRRLAGAGLLADDGELPRPHLSFSARLVIADTSPLLLPLCRLLRRVPARAGTIGLAALLIAGAAGIAVRGDRLVAAYAVLPLAALLGPEHLVTMAILVWLLGLGHEAAHAVTALMAGCRAAALGMAVSPWRGVTFFAELPGLALLPRSARVWVAASGPLWDAAAGMGALLLGWIWPASREAAALIAAAALLRAVWNLLPMPRTDGAYLLTQLVRVRAFRRAGVSAVQRR
ncbi:MAG: hypothetical protein RDU83_07170 [bacterium]|nr:hypothetical protein [bacterium]